jgi:antitoxin component of MazEF toxin-antitoxin module
MQSEIGQWGNSLALRIPAKLAREHGFTKNAQVDITVEDGRLVVTASKKKERAERLERILASIREIGPMEEIPSGPERGREIVEW